LNLARFQKVLQKRPECFIARFVFVRAIGASTSSAALRRRDTICASSFPPPPPGQQLAEAL
jgi:hypothetical protein